MICEIKKMLSLKILIFIMPEIAQLVILVLCFNSLAFLSSFLLKNQRVFSNVNQLKDRLDSILAGPEVATF